MSRNKLLYNPVAKRKVVIFKDDVPSAKALRKGRKYGWYKRRGGSNDALVLPGDRLVPRFIMRRAAKVLDYLSPERRARAVENVMRMVEGAYLRKQRIDREMQAYRKRGKA